MVVALLINSCDFCFVASPDIYEVRAGHKLEGGDIQLCDLYIYVFVFLIINGNLENGLVLLVNDFCFNHISMLF